MKIVIPTYQRAGRIAKNGGSLHALSPVLDKITLVVRPEERESYIPECENIYFVTSGNAYDKDWMIKSLRRTHNQTFVILG